MTGVIATSPRTYSNERQRRSEVSRLGNVHAGQAADGTGQLQAAKAAAARTTERWEALSAMGGGRGKGDAVKKAEWPELAGGSGGLAW